MPCIPLLLKHAAKYAAQACLLHWTVSCAPLQLDAVTINGEGAVATLKIDGYSNPMPLYVGVAEAAAILYASGMEFRRPSTVNAWRNSLKVP